MPLSFWQKMIPIPARKGIFFSGLCGAAVLCVPTAWSHETVTVLQSTAHKVTQVVVGAEDGQTYVMSTRLSLDGDLLLVTPSMAQSGKPFSPVHDTFAPVKSLSLVPSNDRVQASPLPMQPGLKEVQAHTFNTVYELIYQHNGRWLLLETAEPPNNGQLVLTDAVKKASRSLWGS